MSGITDPQCGDSDDSHCIEAGDPNIEDIVLDCEWGWGSITSDMGAYGGGDSTLLEIQDSTPPIPESYLLPQNYPSPFNASTEIGYSLAIPSEVIIDIYDVLERHVETLLRMQQQAGQHQIFCDASDHSSGLYFNRIKAGEFTETRRMVLLK